MAVKVHWFQIEPNLKEYEYEFTGLSTDEKPQDERVAANSLFLELDTGDFYYCESAASKGKKTLLYENDSLTDWNDNGSNYYLCILKTELNVEDLPSTAIIKWDANEYECAIKELYEGYEYEYGGESDGLEYDFSTYPFSVYYEKREDGNEITFISPNNNTHSIEIYSLTPDTPAVWKKVGGGSSPEPTPTPSEVLWEGTLTASNAYEGGSGYMSDEPVEVSASFPNKITVVYNEVSYECSAYESEGYTRYGAPWDNGLGGFDFSEYPFHIINYADNEYGFIFANLGTYEIKILADGSEPEPSGEKLFDGNVTTVEDNDVFVYEFSPMVALNYSSIIVEFDGTRYTAQNYANGENWYAFGKEMGSPSDEYPFGLVFGNNGNQGLATQIYTESAGTYSLKIWANSEEGEMPVPVPPLG